MMTNSCHLEAKQYLERIREDWQAQAKQEAEEAQRKKQEWEALPEAARLRILAGQAAEKTALEKLRVEKERQAQEREWKNRGIPPRYFGATWENWIAKTPEEKNALEQIKQAWEKNLFVSGGNGTGKTHLAMCLVKDGATYCLIPDLFRSVRENQDMEHQTIEALGSCRLLILDEIGRQKGSNFEINLLFEIINKRWNNMLPTIIIGNIGRKELKELCGAAIVDRLRPEIVELDGKSKRVSEAK